MRLPDKQALRSTGRDRLPRALGNAQNRSTALSTPVWARLGDGGQ